MTDEPGDGRVYVGDVGWVRLEDVAAALVLADIGGLPGAPVVDFVDEPAPFDPAGSGLAPGGLVVRLYEEDRATVLVERRLVPTDGDDLVARAAEADGDLAFARLADGKATWLVIFDGDGGAVMEAIHLHSPPA